mmetsp:Transcript_74300/g.118320  ORF Transcript_74300/g.118320 Transcript_74300/m.118320 type:complete len:92 (+) Transcript_74300:129-404(+)
MAADSKINEHIAKITEHITVVKTNTEIIRSAQSKIDDANDGIKAEMQALSNLVRSLCSKHNIQTGRLSKAEQEKIKLLDQVKRITGICNEK